MVLFSGWTSAKTRAAACLAALALACLALSPRPPADPILGALAQTLRSAARGALEAWFILGTLGGLILLLVAVALALSSRAKAQRRNAWQLLLLRLAAFAAIYGLITLLSHFKHQPPNARPHLLPVAPASAHAGPVAKGPSIPAVPASPSLLPFIVAGVALLAAAGLLGFALLRRRTETETRGMLTESALVAAARHRLELGDHVRDAIIACYAEMCGIFTGRGERAYRNHTPREFAALLRSRGAGEPEILALTAVFEKARYSDEACGEADRERAVAALKVLEDHYARGAA